MSTGKIINFVIALAGGWEILSPIVLGHMPGSLAFWNTLVVGVLVLSLGAVVIASKDRLLNELIDWIIVMLGGWLLGAPFLLSISYSSVLVAGDATIVGVLLIFLGILAAFQFRRLEPFPSPEDSRLMGPVYGRGQGSQPPVASLGRGSFSDWQVRLLHLGTSDEEILQRVVHKLDQNWQLSDDEIRVTVRDGEVTLQGEVTTSEDRLVAEKATEMVAGVRRVHNLLHSPS